ncbi:glycosyltransferase family 4 protein [Sphingomonas sp. PL-96]|uniref:glycosyltransferase family 4 protein n=1 Tax=Sphingomonas sp. PL-96 TaxID=2887201 RepID=UPI001E624AEF|nr:glycosyltransferase family 4 protein [Sphingomonas sp. PL-96]MCC2976610.1 glycosyltransferase family 4 protein [Sphingomonas sp. PL-96]
MREARVVILSDYVGGGGAATGGAGHAVQASYRALRAAGVDVRVIAGFGPVPPKGSERFMSLGGSDLREKGGVATLASIYNPGAAAALRTALAGADRARTVVILHQWTRYLSPAVVRALAGFRLMVYMHEYFWACPNGAYYDFQLAAPCTRRPMGAACLAADCDRQGRVHKLGRVLRQAALLVARIGSADDRLCLHLSERARATAAPLLPGEQHAVLYNPGEVGLRPPPTPDNPRYDVGYFGRLEPEKGVTLLAQAITRGGLSGLLVGEGSLGRVAAGWGGITYRAWQPRETMLAAMRRCRVVVLPSLWHETWGLIVPEAMAAGVAVLVSSRAGSAELVDRFGGGLVFDPGVPGDLERKLDIVLNPRPGECLAPVRDWAGFREALSARRHAQRLIELAASTWGLDLGGAPGVSAARPVASAASIA